MAPRWDMRARALVLAAAAAAAFAAAGCGGGSKSPPPPPPPPPPSMSIAITPSAVEVEPGGAVQFTAVTTGDVGSIGWSVEGTGTGTISSTGLYQAPDVSVPPVTIVCSRVFDPSLRATATVTFPPISVAVSPPSAVVALGGTTRFTATVTGSKDVTVTWSSTDGSMDPDGTFHAPTTTYVWDVNVSARAVATGATGTASAHLVLAPPVLSAVDPGAPGETVTVSGTGLAYASTVLFPGAGGSEIPVGAAGVTPTAVTVVVPVGATSGPLTVEAQAWGFDPVRSNAIAFARAPRIRLHPDRRDLGPGDTTQMRVAWLGAAGPLPLTFSADVGTVTAGTYAAPAAVPADAFAHVQACITGTARCHAVVLGLHPFTTAPNPPLVAAGGSLALAAYAGGAAVPATWSLLAGGGAVSADGVYAASALPEDGGLALLAATAAGATAAVPVGVTGATPGLLARFGDYVDNVQVPPVGAYVEALAVAGTRAYAFASQPEALSASRTYFWIDVYDVADPVNPIWLGAVESATRPSAVFALRGRLYAFSPSDWSAGGIQGTLAVYDLSGDLPAAIVRETWPSVSGVWGRFAHDGDRLYFFDDPPAGSRTFGLRVYETVSGPFVLERTTSLTVPNEADLGQVYAMTVAGDRVYLPYLVTAPSVANRVAIYDLSAEPPALVSIADGGGFSLGAVGSLLFADHAYATFVYDRTGDALALRATFPFGSAVLGSDASRAVLHTYQSGVYVVDVSAPQAPRLATTLFGGLQMGGGALAGDRLLLAEGLGGFAIYDVGAQGGPLHLGTTPVPPGMAAPVFDVAYRSPDLYAVGPDWSGAGWLGTYDAGVIPPALVDVRALPDVGYGLALVGTTLAVATPSGLVFLDLSNPAAPSPTATLGISASCVRAGGTGLYVGTLAGDLVVVDPSDPALPVARGSVALPGMPYAIAPAGPGVVAVALEAGTDGAIALVDVSVAASPVLLASVAMGAPAYGVAVENGHAFVATAGGLALVDVSDPSSPQLRWHVALAGHYPFAEAYTPVGAVGIAVHRGIVWVGTLDANAIVYGLDARDVAWPRIVSVTNLGQQIVGAVVAFAFDDAGHVFVSGGDFGSYSIEIETVDLSQPRNVIREDGAPRALQR